MKKLINPSPNGGVPYQNSDFTDILQNQSSWLPFSRILDDMREWSPGPGDGNIQGIILGGIDVIGLTDSNSKIRVRFANPIVYINGEALTGNYSGVVETDPIWIYEAPQTFEQRILRNGSQSNVIVNRTFTYSTSNPGTNSIYLGTSSSFNHIRNVLYGYSKGAIDNTYFVYNGFQDSNTPSRSPYEQLSWNRPYISHIGSSYLGDVTTDKAWIITIPDQGTNQYVVNGCFSSTFSNINQNDLTFNIFNKNTGSFSIYVQENSSDTQSVYFDFSIIKNPNNAALQITTASAIS